MSNKFWPVIEYFDITWRPIKDEALASSSLKEVALISNPNLSYKYDKQAAKILGYVW